MLLMNIMAALFLLFSYISTYISPAFHWVFGFITLAYPLILFGNILFLLYWPFFRWKLIFISGLTILAGFSQFSATIHPGLPGTEKKPEGGIKIMSYNVRLFDLYNWSHNLRTRNLIFNLLKQESPDIICFQEFYYSDAGDFRNLDTLIQFQPAVNYHIGILKTLRNTDHWGIATFSRYPIINKGSIVFNNANSETFNTCIYTDVVLPENDTVRIYNVHFQSIQFDYEDYKFIENPQKSDEEKQLESSKKILRRLKYAFEKRANQAEIVSRHVRSSPYPVLVCGDFNDPPVSYTYRQIADRNDLLDAFTESGYGIGNTYAGTFPSYRIDYILHHKNFSSAGYRTIRQKLSDHYPIVCYLLKSSK